MLNIFKRKRKLKDYSYFELAMCNGDIFYCVDDKKKYSIILVRYLLGGGVDVLMSGAGCGGYYADTNDYEFDKRFKKVVRLSGD